MGNDLNATRAPGQRRFIVLDVGAGPLTWCGFALPGGDTLEIIPVDPLAKLYDVALAQANVSPIVRTRHLRGEELTRDFPPDFFDFVVAVNSADHSQEPLEVFRQMVTLVKPGHLVRIQGHTNEAIEQGYTGMHQWNFANVDGKFIVFRKGARDVDVLFELRDIVQSIECNEASLSYGRTKPGGFISCTLKKKS